MAARVKTTTVATMKFRVNVNQGDIENGECRVATRCMEKVAVTRALKKEFSIPDDKVRDLHVRVDAGHIRFNYGGHHWDAPTPKIAKASLIKFDRKKSVEPHSYVVSAIRKDKISPMTEDRKRQINIARAKRASEGKPDRAYRDITIRQRIVGYDLGRSRSA